MKLLGWDGGPLLPCRVIYKRSTFCVPACTSMLAGAGAVEAHTMLFTASHWRGTWLQSCASLASTWQESRPRHGARKVMSPVSYSSCSVLVAYAVFTSTMAIFTLYQKSATFGEQASLLSLANLGPESRSHLRCLPGWPSH